MTPAESTALRALMLLVVEVQNAVSADKGDPNAFTLRDKIVDLADSDHAREHVQLARAVTPMLAGEFLST